MTIWMNHILTQRNQHCDSSKPGWSCKWQSVSNQSPGAGEAPEVTGPLEPSHTSACIGKAGRAGLHPGILILRAGVGLETLHF